MTARLNQKAEIEIYQAQTREETDYYKSISDHKRWFIRHQADQTYAFKKQRKQKEGVYKQFLN